MAATLYEYSWHYFTGKHICIQMSVLLFNFTYVRGRAWLSPTLDGVSGAIYVLYIII